MTDQHEELIRRDTVSRNFLFESISRMLVYIGGIVSSALLTRSLDITTAWTIVDYANLKVLMNWSNVVAVFITLGISTSIIKSVSENARNRENVGRIITISLITVTFTFVLVSFITVFFAEPLNFLVESTPEATNEMRFLWILVLLSFLPTAYTRIIYSVFSGVQRRIRILTVDIIFNLSRIILIVYLFLSSSLTIFSIIIMFLITNLIAFILAGIILVRLVRIENIKLGIEGWRKSMGQFWNIFFVFGFLSFISVFFNFVTPLFVDALGTDLDMARYSWSQNTVYTIRNFISAPFAVLLPNIAAYYAQGRIRELKDRFDESNRIIIPTLLFVAISVFIFGDAALGTIYGIRALDSTGGYSAFQFMQIMALNLFFIPLSTLYGNLLTALGRLRFLLAAGLISVILQALWIILLQPIFGIIIIALSWIIYIPVFLGHHIYCKKRLDLTISTNLLKKTALLAIILVPLAVIFSNASIITLEILGFIPLLKYTTFYSLGRALFIVPMWYLFIGICISLGILKPSDMESLKRFLKKIPPIWWVSKPILRIMEKALKRTNTI
ncbi:MAG: membrane protein of unknown function [Candidatus Thorarchaeota archaeon]|nr:MAG: membrane protein of unknown function [Candidatus Thorarchaeota archaeon]